MGAVLVPLLAGLDSAAADLPHASSLCGACSDACPVKIPLHELLLELRSDLVDEGVAPFRERLAFRLWSHAWSSPAGYRLTTRLARLGGPFAGFAGPGRGWGKGRALPKLGRRYRDGR
jgi:L-lactate dehydrogenase complex protein LldF